jgi:hypothetical protein
MLIPVVAPLCLAGRPMPELTRDSVALAFTAIALHTATMLVTIAAIAIVVYRWVGIAFLRRGWINLDLVWTGGLIVCGLVLLVV